MLPVPVASNEQQRRKSAGLQRLTLLAFTALLVLLFAALAVTEGLGDPSVPSDAVAVVEDAPDDLGTITKAEFDRALVQAAAATQVTPVPKPGDDKYEELKETALGELLDAVWLHGQAAEMGIEVTPKEIADELEKLKEQAFKTEKQYRKFLEESKFTKADVDKRVTLQILSTKIQEQIGEGSPIPSSDEIEEYYEAAKSSQFTTPESRDIRFVVNQDKASVDAAKAALEKDDSIESWKKVAKKYSSDPATKGNGGLQSAISEGGVSEPLNAAVFAAGQGELEGPIDDSRGLLVFEVETITPESVQGLDAVKSQISTQLTEQAQQQHFAAFVRNYNSLWTSRTFCAEDFLIARCANFEGDGRSPEADPACYEADPKTPAEACPAPALQVKPAQPGSVSLLTPEGQKLPQRPRPAGEEAAAAAPTEGLGIPPAGVPTE